MRRLCRWLGHSWGPMSRGVFWVNAATVPPRTTGYGPFPRSEEMDYRNCHRCGVLDIPAMATVIQGGDDA